MILPDILLLAVKIKAILVKNPYPHHIKIIFYYSPLNLNLYCFYTNVVITIGY